MSPTDQTTTTFEQDLATLKRTGYLLLPGGPGSPDAGSTDRRADACGDQGAAVGMKLSDQQKLDILNEGYTVIPGLIDEDPIKRTRHAINHSIGEVGM